ncbi:MAG: peptidylprolyl isomerase, partial [Acidithiobacillus ferriphilus]
NGQGLDNAALVAAFTTPAPAGGVPSMDMVKTSSGYQIFAVTRVTAPSAAAINPKVATQIRASLEEQRGRLLSTAYLKDLREHAKVKINNVRLAQISH